MTRRLAAGRATRSLLAAIGAMGMVNLTMGITFPLAGIILSRQGVASSLIGLSAAAQALPVFFVSPFVPRLIGHYGPARLMLVGLVMAAVSIALMGLYPDLWVWFPLRFVLGCAGTLLWATSEAWINALAPEEKRGRILGIYSAAAALGFALGPTTIVLVGTSVMPLYIGAGLMMLAAALVATADRSENHFGDDGSGTLRLGMWRILWIAPAAILVNFFYAAAGESLTTFFALYAAHFGVAEQKSLSLLTIAAIGAIVIQPVIGAMADRFHRLALLVALTLATLVAYILLPFALPDMFLTGLAVFTVVGLASGLFTVGMVLIGERFKGQDLATASSFTTLMWGFGALVGAPLSGLAMQLWTPQGLILSIVMIYGVYLIFPITAWWQERAGIASTGRSQD